MKKPETKEELLARKKRVQNKMGEIVSLWQWFNELFPTSPSDAEAGTRAELFKIWLLDAHLEQLSRDLQEIASK